MNTAHTKLAAPALRIEDDERHLIQTDEFIARNRETLNDSIRRSRLAAAQGTVSAKGIDTIIAEGRQRHAIR
jgi:hypothetical protein